MWLYPGVMPTYIFQAGHMRSMFKSLEYSAVTYISLRDISLTHSMLRFKMLKSCFKFSPRLESEVKC